LNAPELEPIATISAEFEKAAEKIAEAWQPLVDAAMSLTQK
jgi:hypothetical protein